MLDYIDVLKALEIKKNKKIRIVFLSNFNNLILNNYINYFFKCNSEFEIKFHKTEFDQIFQQIFDKKFIKDILNNDYLILGLDANISLNFNEQKIVYFIKEIKNYIEHINNTLTQKNILIFNLSYTESYHFLNKV